MTHFERGERMRITLIGYIDDDGDLALEPGGMVLPGGSTPGDGYMKLQRLVDSYGAQVEPANAPAPAPYTEPRADDEVEVVVRGTLVRHCGDPACGDWNVEADVPGYGRQCYQVLRNVWTEGRVRLVKAAAPTYEAGRIYRSETTGERWLLYPTDPKDGPGQPWFHIDAGRMARMWHNEREIPSDLRPCDVVPREAT